MKNNKYILKTILIIMTLVLAAFVTACSSNDDDGSDVEDLVDGVELSLEFPSDSDNGLEWKLEQSDNVFSCEDIFREDEGATDGNGETHLFQLRPVKAGSTTLVFTNSTGDTKYTYECQVDDKMENITVTSAAGEANGEPVDPPEPVIERD